VFCCVVLRFVVFCCVVLCGWKYHPNRAALKITTKYGRNK
jgi:hypothetical protein